MANRWHFGMAGVLALALGVACRTAAPARSSATLTDVCAAAGAPGHSIVAESYRIPSSTPGIELYLRNKRPAGDVALGRAVVFVHGATYPSQTTFDMPLGGYSWLDFVACRGWDAYLVDLRGYGGSTRPPQMDRPAEESGPVSTADEAVQDLGRVIDHVLARRRGASVALVGWSWGTTLVAPIAISRPEVVSRLVLYGPVWLFPLDPDTEPIPAYRTVTVEDARKRWLGAVPESRRPTHLPDGWFEAWSAATWATDPEASRTGKLRAPNGVLQDSRDHWEAGRPRYNPAAILVPILLVAGEWDVETPPEMGRALSDKISPATSKRMVVVPEGTHFMMLERARETLFREVQAFLDEPPAR